jgi:hypothetical protein
VDKSGKKTGGRKPGSKNLATVLRTARVAELEAALERNKLNLIDELRGLKKDLKPNEWAQVLCALLPFRYPKLKSVEIKAENPFDTMTHEQLLEFSKKLTKFLETGESDGDV